MVKTFDFHGLRTKEKRFKVKWDAVVNRQHAKTLCLIKVIFHFVSPTKRTKTQNTTTSSSSLSTSTLNENVPNIDK